MLGLGGCWVSEPDRAEALAMISTRIRAGFGPGEKMLANLQFRKGDDLGDGRYEMFVDYELVSTMAEVGLFNTALRVGEHQPVLAERYVFVHDGGEWVLQ
jgi:hypothetical protein